SGLILQDGRNSEVYQNLIVENGGVGIFWDVPDGERGPRIVNNTICNNTFAGIDCWVINPDVFIINNIIVGNPAIRFEGLYYPVDFPVISSNNIFSWTGNIFFGR